jgi:ubiquinol-cytochrome c reductase iron-sulfur subunit
MSNTNSPDSGPGDTAWQEFLTGGGDDAAGVSSAGASSGSASSGSASSGSASSGSADPAGASASAAGPGDPAVPHRVIGTPPPATARTMLPARGDDGPQPPARELPADSDGDPRRAKKAELIVATCFILAMFSGFGFLVSYGIIGVGSIVAVQHSNLALGATLSLTLLLLAIGATIWVRHLMPDVELTEQRHPMATTPAERQAFQQTFEEGAEASQFVKRPILRRTLIAATVPLGVAPLFLLRDMGPLPGTSLDHTVWRKGLRLMTYGTTPPRPITPAEFSSPGGLISVGPEGYLDDDDAMAKAAVIIIKFRPSDLAGNFTTANHAVANKVVENWTVENIVAYSKICTHVGCPAALYEQTTHHILCPCHQSTFVANQGARVIFGPATRPLPQLPMGVDSQGYLVALSDFQEPVGPSFWERS